MGDLGHHLFGDQRDLLDGGLRGTEVEHDEVLEARFGVLGDQFDQPVAVPCRRTPGLGPTCPRC